MNSLSLFLWALDVVGRLGVFFALFAAFCGFVVGTILTFELYEAKKLLVATVFAGFISVFIAVLIPSPDTMKLIAISQVGEQVLKLEQVQNIGGEAAELARISIEALRAQVAQTIPKE